MNTPVHFNCIAGCGACCKGRFVPLTLAETEAWLARGDDVVVLLEAFATLDTSEASAEYRHNHARSAAARSGSADIQIIAVFAAANLQGCPNQLADSRCGIYTERPLVCRIYPMEVNPFIAMDPAAKECPAGAWSQTIEAPLIASDGLPPPALRQLIDASRQADRDDAQAKVDICRHLGFATAAWKGNGFSVFFPSTEQLQEAIVRQRVMQPSRAPWHLHVHGEALHEQLVQQGMLLTSDASDHVFIPLTA